MKPIDGFGIDEVNMEDEKSLAEQYEGIRKQVAQDPKLKTDYAEWYKTYKTTKHRSSVGKIT